MNPQDVNMTNNPRPFVCDKCGETFSSAYLREKHEREFCENDAYSNRMMAKKKRILDKEIHNKEGEKKRIESEYQEITKEIRNLKALKKFLAFEIRQFFTDAWYIPPSD